MGDYKHSPLDAEHRVLGAKMLPFAGWEMPIEYEGTIAEHTSVRERAGLFDVSHLGKVLVTGDGAGEWLDRVLSNRFASLAPGRARYTLLLNDEAGIVDDIIGYALAPGRFLVVPNGANVERVLGALSSGAPDRITVEHVPWITLAVQGPAAREAMKAFPDAEGLGYMRCAGDGDVVVARTGYTGELGFEIFAPPSEGKRLWDAALDGVRAAGGMPCGLGARDTLRLEMGYPLHGNDIDATTTPKEAGLTWAVAADKPAFIGKAAYESSMPRQRLVGIKMSDRRIPRRGCDVLADGVVVGSVTSGTFSPTLRAGIALAYVAPSAAEDGAAIEVDVRGKRGAGVITSPPFVESSPKG